MKILETLWLDARSGQRGKIETGESHMFYAGVDRKPRADDEKPETSPETRQILQTETFVQRVGSVLEVDPVIGADGLTIDLNVTFDFHYAPPVMSGESRFDAENRQLHLDAAMPTFRKARVSTALTMQSGKIRMLGTWRPDEKDADVMQALFLRAQIIRAPEEDSGN